MSIQIFNHPQDWSLVNAIPDPKQVWHDGARIVVRTGVDIQPNPALAQQTAFDVNEPNLKDLIDQAQGALDTNTTFLALATPSNAQLSAQARALTQQNSKIINVLLRFIAQQRPGGLAAIPAQMAAPVAPEAAPEAPSRMQRAMQRIRNVFTRRAEPADSGKGQN